MAAARVNVNPETNLINTQEMYLKSVLECLELEIPPRRARIGERLRHSNPTVSQTVARLQEKKLCTLDASSHIVLSAEGKATAARVLYAHRIIECFLADVIGLEWTELHAEACRWEHVASAPAIDRIARLVRHRALDPYGNRISRSGKVWARPLAVMSAAEVPPGATVRGALTRIGEPAQAEPGFLRQLATSGIGMRSAVTLQSDERGQISLACEDGELIHLPHRLRPAVFVDRRDVESDLFAAEAGCPRSGHVIRAARREAVPFAAGDTRIVPS